jgi:hypothetical protein
MALTLISEQITPLESYTNAVWSVQSNNPLTRKVTGSFIGINGNGVAGAIQPSVQVSVGSTGLFSFDLMEFFRDQLTYDIQTPATATDITTAPNSYFTLNTAGFIELVDDNGQLVTGGSLAVSTSKVVINAARQVYNPAGLDGFVINPSVAGLEEFLTDSPRQIDIATGESYVLSVYSASNTVNAISVNFRDSGGVSLGSSVVTYSTTALGRYDIPIGLANLATIGINPPTGSYDYRVSIGVDTGSYARASEFFVFKLVENCQGTYRIHFLNRWGGFDSYTFKGFSSQNISTNSTVYEKYLSNGFTVQDRGRQSQYREASTGLTLQTNILNTEQSQWLSQLITSPVAYMELDGALVPITIADQTATILDENKLLQYTIGVTFASDIRNQRL